MAGHGICWVLGTHVRFGDLDFIVMVEGELAWAPVVVQPFHSIGLNVNTAMLKPPVVAADGGERLDGGVSQCQLSSHRDDEF